MAESLLDRLVATRGVLAGVDGNGTKVHASMFDSDVISLAHGDGTCRPHPSVIAAGIAALLETRRGSLDDYLFLQRHEEFDAEVSADFERNGVPPELARNVCVDSGTTRLFAAFLYANTDPGDVFLVPRSFYHPLPSWCELFRVELSLVPTGAGTSYKLSPDDLHIWFRKNRHDPRRVRGLFLFNPTQTGAVYTNDELKALGAAVHEHGLVVLEDCIFAGTEFPRSPKVTHLVTAAPDLSDRIVSLKGASKAFNLANIRLGWGCGPREIIHKMNEYTTTTIATVPYLAKAMVLAALRVTPHYFELNSAESAGRAALITELVDECNSTLAPYASGAVLAISHLPEAGHAILVGAPGLVGRRLPGADGVVQTSLGISRFLLSKGKVAVSPGYALGFDGPELRIVFGSVGQKHTYAASAPAELAAATQEVLIRGGTPKETILRILEQISVPETTTGQMFEPGRDLIRAAFIDRIIPLLRRVFQDA